MASATIKGGAPASPHRSLARQAGRFIAIGGRLMVDPWGRFHATISAARLLERTWPVADDPAPFEHRRRIATRYTQAEQGNESKLADLVRARGKLTVNGWLVWEAL